MKKLLLFFASILISNCYSQDTLPAFSKDELVGKTIRFLKVNRDNYLNRYSSFSSSKSSSTNWLPYDKYEGRFAKVEGFKKYDRGYRTDYIYALKMLDGKEKVYLHLERGEQIAGNNIAIVEHLEEYKNLFEGKELYVNNERVKVLEIKYNDDKESSALPILVVYQRDNQELVSKDVLIMRSNLFLSNYKKVGNGTPIALTTFKKSDFFDLYFSKSNNYGNVTLDSVESKFQIERDEMDDRIIYQSRLLLSEELKGYGIEMIDYNSNNLISRVVEINGAVLFDLFSNYSSSDWIFHDKFKLKAQEKTLESPIAAKNRREVLSGGRVNEQCDFDAIFGLEVADFIYQYINEEINIRFYGRDYYKDYTLSFNEKMAIFESLQLYKLLKGEK